MFENLFRPGRIGTMEVKNRIIKPAQGMMTADEKGFVTPLQLKLYSRWAQGGTGLVIVEVTAIDFTGSLEMPSEIVAASDEYIPGLAELARAIKENGARAGLQISHCGGSKVMPPAYAPSAMRYESMLGTLDAQELTVAEIEEIIEAYGQAAGRVKRAGFDMVEIHMAHGYLVAEFFSPRTNLRTDRYGGSLENRLRFPLEVLECVRSHVGKDFPISCRISATEYEENGTTLVDSIQLAQALERGGIDILNVSVAGVTNNYKILIQTYFPRAYNVYLAEAMKKSGGIKVPVICNGGITTPELAEEILAAGKADFVAVGRPLWADPDWPKKAQEGRSHEIRPCLRGGISCVGAAAALQGMHCSVNPEFRVEYEQTLEPVAKPRNVAVLGGGPGGLEAARIAAIKGHKVTLYEKRDILGGNIVEDSVPRFKSERRSLVSYFENELKRLGVTVKHQEATVETIERGGFDVAIAAIGSKRKMPKIRGADKSLVIDIVEAFQGKMKGENVVIVATDYEVRCVDVALYAAEQDKKATLLFTQETREQLMETFAVEDGVMNMQSIMEILPQRPNIEVHLGVKLLEITDQGVVVDKEGKKQTFAADTVILVPDFAPNDDLAKALEKRGLEVHKVGDCVEPMRHFRDAIHEGHLAARQL